MGMAYMGNPALNLIVMLSPSIDSTYHDVLSVLAGMITAMLFASCPHAILKCHDGMQWCSHYGQATPNGYWGSSVHHHVMTWKLLVTGFSYNLCLRDLVWEVYNMLLPLLPEY